jgi:hypothetical protein
MAHPDDTSDDDGFFSSQPVPDSSQPAPDGQRSRRRKQVAGAVGLVAVLGGGAFLITDQMTDRSTTISDTGAVAPIVPATASPTVALGPAPAKASPTPKGTSPSPAKSLTTEQKIAAARAAMAKDGVPVKRPPVRAGSQLTAADVTVTNKSSAGGTLKVASARGDLTGYGEMSWVADDGRPVGDARCSQNFRFANSVPIGEKPTLLVCWLTSATKSVYTVAVVPKGRPSTATSVAAIDAEWAKLG